MEKIFQMFERIVVATERMAAAAERTAQAAVEQTAHVKMQAEAVAFERGASVTDPAQVFEHIPAAAGAPPTPATPPPAAATPPTPATPPPAAATPPAGAPPTPATPPAGTPPTPGLETWNPYTDQKVIARYKEPKGSIMRNELTRRGVEGTEKMTGQQLHRLLLKMGPEGAQGSVPPTPAGAPPTPATLPAETITLDHVRGALSELMAKSEAAKAEGLRLLNEVGGVSRLTDATTGQQLIAPEAVAPLYTAVQNAIGYFNHG